MQDTILVMDDQSSAMQSVTRLLRNEMYTVLTATGADEAFAILNSQTCKVLISDHNQGISFFCEAKRKFPETVRIMLLEKGSTELIITAIVDLDVFHLLLKPCDAESLKATVKAAVQMFSDKERLRKENFQQTNTNPEESFKCFH